MLQKFKILQNVSEMHWIIFLTFWNYSTNSFFPQEMTIIFPVINIRCPPNDTKLMNCEYCFPLNPMQNFMCSYACVHAHKHTMVQIQNVCQTEHQVLFLSALIPSHCLQTYMSCVAQKVMSMECNNPSFAEYEKQI